jgi:transposase
VDVRNGQRVMIEFYTAEGASPIEIYRRMRIVYGEDTIDVGSVGRWVRRFKSGEKDIGDRPCNGRPATAVTTERSSSREVL